VGRPVERRLSEMKRVHSARLDFVVRTTHIDCGLQVIGVASGVALDQMQRTVAQEFLAVEHRPARAQELSGECSPESVQCRHSNLGAHGQASHRMICRKPE